jgi:hypothetical protein
VADIDPQAIEQFGIIALNIGAPVQTGPVIDNLTAALTLVASGAFTAETLQLFRDNLGEARIRTAVMLAAMDAALDVTASLSDQDG